MILLCAHQDTVKPAPILRIDLTTGLYGAGYVGLLDNILGVIAVQSAIYRNASLFRMMQEGSLGIFHHDGEEFLRDISVPKLQTPDFALVVDVVSGEKYTGLDAAIENMTIPEDYFGNFFQEEGYYVTTKAFTGETADQDEAWVWKDLGIPTCSMLLPIDSSGGNWHRSDCTCPLVRVDTFINVLTRMICYLTEDYG